VHVNDASTAIFAWLLTTAQAERAQIKSSPRRRTHRRVGAEFNYRRSHTYITRAPPNLFLLLATWPLASAPENPLNDEEAALLLTAGAEY
jgi:hypothetical protein